MGDSQISIPPSSIKINLPRVIFLFGKFKRDWGNLSHPRSQSLQFDLAKSITSLLSHDDAFQLLSVLLKKKISNSCLGFFISVFLNFYFCAFVVLTFYLATNSFTKQGTKIFIYSRHLCFAHTGTTDFFSP